MHADALVQQKIATCRSNRSKELVLRDCALSNVPEEVFSLDHLSELDLSNTNANEKSNNRLTSLSGNIANLTNLKTLGLSNNRLQSLPKEIDRLDNLRELYLDGNAFSKVPDAIYRLSGLRTLGLSRNEISELPEAFSRLSGIRSLHLKNLQLGHFPDQLCRLQSLRYLDLSGNHFRELPKQLVQLHNLEHLSVEDVPINNVPPEIIARGIKAIANFFKELGDFDYLYEIKLILVGEGRVGKTVLAKTLSNPTYLMGDEQSTEGIDVSSWIIPRSEIGLSKDFRLNIWDFGGQEIYHSTHQFFLTKRSVYLLVTESRKEDRHEDFYYWLNIIKILADKSPVMIVLNKCDQPTKELPINEYRKAFENVVGFEKVSCVPEPKYRTRIKVLKDEIKRIITDRDLAPHIGSALPKVWITIRNELEDLKQSGRNYISVDEYLEICKRHERDEKSALYLSEFFHDLGVILHFSDDWGLHDTLFLKHEWVTNAVYKVLDNEKVIEQSGRFSNDDLSKIWSEKPDSNGFCGYITC